MNDFMLMKNSLIEDTFKTPEKTNSLKTVMTVRGDLQDSATVAGTVYGRTYLFDLEPLRKYNGLQDMFIHIKNIEISGDALTGPIESFASKMIKNILIRTKSGVVLMFYDYIHSIMRIDEASGTSLMSFYNDAIRLCTGGSTDSYLPIFSWFNHQNRFDLRDRDPIEVLVTINDFSGYPDFATRTVASFDLDVLCIFHDVPAKAPVRLYEGYDVLYDPQYTRLGAYDLYYEQFVSFIPSATNDYSVSLNLTCPYPAYVMHISAGAAGSFFGITSWTLDFPSRRISSMDARTNFQIGNLQHFGNEDESVVNYWFTKDVQRTNVSDLLEFSDSLYPSILTVRLLGSTNPVKIYVWFEYISDLAVDSKGQYLRNVTGLFKGGFSGSN
jgi:hypothetical protein